MANVAVLYTNTDQIRSALGISLEDMPDTVITDRSLATELSVDLHTWLPTHATIAADVSTAQAVFLSDSLKLYCAYFCAAAIAESPLAFIQKISDGKNSADRFTNLDWKEIVNGLTSRMAGFKQAILAVVSPTNPLALTYVKQFSRIQPANDPVTG